VRVEDLWVRFRTTRERQSTLKHAIRHARLKSKSKIRIDALRGVSFEVPTGSVYGVIGPNGAGKTTLFRTLAGIYPPTAGRISLYGRVTPLLSLGVGFNRELSGRENVFIGGLAAGLEPQYIKRRYNEIVDFADIGNAIDQPMRTYSSGMFGRVAFSIAAHLDPEIILIDEALAAGDAAFKQKSSGMILDLIKRECTIMIISHGLDLVKQLSDRCLWLDHGTIQAEGPADEVVDAYLKREKVDPEAPAALEDL
jgi:teichoic acid transport system ATP-binding protein